MSVESKASNIPTTEHTAEIQQESSQPSSEGLTVETEADVDKFQGNTDVIESSDSDVEEDVSDKGTGEIAWLESNLHESVASSDVNMDLQKTASSVGSGSESQKDGVSDVGGVMELQQDVEESRQEGEPRGTGANDSEESEQSGEALGTDSEKNDAAVGTDSEKNVAAVGRELKQSIAAVSTESQNVAAFSTDSKESGTAFSTDSNERGAAAGTELQPSVAAVGTESEQDIAVGGIIRRLSLESSASVDVSCSVPLQGCDIFLKPKSPCAEISGPHLLRQDSENGSTGGSSTGDSQETAVVGKSNSRVSLESGVVGDVSNSPDPQESPTNSTGSWEGMAAPILPLPIANGAIPPGGFPTQVVPGEYVDGRQQVIEDVMSGYAECFGYCARICDYLRPCSRWIRNSKILLFFIRIILAIIAIVAAGLGISNLSHCPAKVELPILMILLGIAGMVLLGTSWVLNPRSSFCPHVHRHCLTAGRVTARLLFLGLFVAVMNATYNMSPSFDPADREKYCDQEFYYFAYYMNFVICGIDVLAFLVYVPTMNENCNDYEQF